MSQSSSIPTTATGRSDYLPSTVDDEGYPRTKGGIEILWQATPPPTGVCSDATELSDDNTYVACVLKGGTFFSNDAGGWKLFPYNEKSFSLDDAARRGREWTDDKDWVGMKVGREPPTLVVDTVHDDGTEKASSYVTTPRSIIDFSEDVIKRIKGGFRHMRGGSEDSRV